MPRNAAAHQLQLEVVPVEQPKAPARLRKEAGTQPKLSLRLALSPDEAARMLGVSRDYFDEHILVELRVVRRGRRILIPLAELDRWLDRAAARVPR